MTNNILIIKIIMLLFCSVMPKASAQQSNAYLLMFTKQDSQETGYKNQQDEITIAAGKYIMCFTDTFRTFAIVLEPEKGFIAIDREENLLYEVYPYDNGPDYPQEGLFRIRKNNQIGYADINTGKIIIEPQYDCAYPFENGKAKVSTDCQSKSVGEYTEWISKNWFFIDTKGKKIE
ncbi:MAG: WG repeat-containing protein [Bernardetiaceae bacterium]|nr:WG repeat-containing protein [Bernardetiaceae bacterium]